MDNRLIAERVFELHRAIRGKNDATAMALQRAIVPLLEYSKPLAGMQRELLLRLDGVGQKSVDLILRVIAGEAIETIAASIPVIVRNRPVFGEPPNCFGPVDRWLALLTLRPLPGPSDLAGNT